MENIKYSSLIVDQCEDAQGNITIRKNDGSENGDTDSQPVATVYEPEYAKIIAAAPELLAEVIRLKKRIQFLEQYTEGKVDKTDFTSTDSAIKKAQDL